MSTDLKQYAPLITQKLDFATAVVYLLKHGVLSVVEYDCFRKALQSGSSTNSNVVHQILPNILKKGREFYRALRECVNDKSEDVHPSNKELFYQLPENFGKGIWKTTISKWTSMKNKSSIPSINEDPVSSSDTDKHYGHRRRSSYKEDDISTDGEGELESELVASHPPGGSRSRMAKSISTHSMQPPQTQTMQIPLRKRKNSLSRQLSVGDDNSNISRSPSIMSLPVALEQYGNSDLHPVTVNVTQLLEDNVNAFKELYHKEKLENEKHKGELENLKLEINTVKEKSKSLAEGFEKLTTEKEIGDEKLKQAMQETDSLRKQLEEMKIIKEKELDEIRAKSNDEKNISIAKEKEYENLIKELQSKYEKTKEYNDILLRENSRMHSEKQELEDTHREGSQLKDKAIQDCSTLMIENDELRKKVNVVLCENRWLRGN